MSANDDFARERGPIGPECFRGSDYAEVRSSYFDTFGSMRPVSAATDVQPAPTSSGGDVWMELIVSEPDEGLRQMYAERRAFGIQKYGTPLQRDNGRDVVADAMQEALDGMVYAQQANHAEALGHFRAALLALRGEG